MKNYQSSDEEENQSITKISDKAGNQNQSVTGSGSTPFQRETTSVTCQNRNSSSESGLQDYQVECPLCSGFYPTYLIEMHAASCNL